MTGKENNQKSRIIQEIALVTFLVIVIFTPIINHIVTGSGITIDYTAHIQSALQLFSSSPIMPYFLWHLCLLFIVQIFHLNANDGAIAVTVFSVILTAIILVYIFNDYQSKYAIRSSLLDSRPAKIVLTLCLLIITPIFILYPLDHLAYLGYIGISGYHNPTSLLCKPLSLLLFYLVIRYGDDTSISRKAVLGIAGLTIVSSLAKPSYLICLLPALVVLVAYRFLSRKKANWSLLGWGVIIPGSAILLLQTYFGMNYLGVTDQNPISFSPFVVFSHYSGYLFPKFFLSILFPLCVYILYFKDAHRDKSLNISWLVFFFGAFYAYFLAESATNIWAGDFGWGAEISLFILFVFSLIFFIRELSDFQKRDAYKIYPLIIIFGLHVIFGILYYFIIFINNSYK
jgi:hypothetical protein